MKKERNYESNEETKKKAVKKKKKKERKNIVTLAFEPWKEISRTENGINLHLFKSLHLLLQFFSLLSEYSSLFNAHTHTYLTNTRATTTTTNTIIINAK